MRHCADLNHGLNGPRLEAAQRKAMQHTCSTSLPPLQKRRVCGAAANSDRRPRPDAARRPSLSRPQSQPILLELYRKPRELEFLRKITRRLPFDRASEARSNDALVRIFRKPVRRPDFCRIHHPAFTNPPPLALGRPLDFGRCSSKVRSRRDVAEVPG